MLYLVNSIFIESSLSAMILWQKPCWLSWHRNYPSRFTIRNEILQSGMPYFPSYVHLKPLSHLTFSHHEHKRLIMMLFLKRFTADCSSFSRMKDLRWVHLLVKLSLLQEWDTAHLWRNLSMFWQPPWDGVCISSRLFAVRLPESISCFSW